MCWKKIQNGHLFDIEFLIPIVWEFSDKIFVFCFCVQFLVIFCTNPLIPSGEIFFDVLDVVSLASVSMDI